MTKLKLTAEQRRALVKSTGVGVPKILQLCGRLLDVTDVYKQIAAFLESTETHLDESDIWSDNLSQTQSLTWQRRW